jgi:Tfp pilus assembly protein PilO
MRYITPIILIGIAITFFFVVTNPMYSDPTNGITALKTQVASYNDALSTSKTLEGERDALTTKYNNIDPNNITKLQKLLPDNVNNIRLILEIEQIAAPYGMTLSGIKYDDTTNTNTIAPTTAKSGGANNVINQASKNYGTFNLEFSTSGTYDNFISFTKDLENNLRIVDVSSISLSSNLVTGNTTNTGVSTKANSPQTYTYDFKIKTYWLKS